MHRWSVVAVVSVLVLAGCGGDKPDKPKAGKDPTPTSTAAAPPDFSGTETNTLIQATYELVEKERGTGKKRDFYATTKPRAQGIVKDVANLVTRVVTDHPASSGATVDYVVTPYDDKALLACAPSDKLKVVLVSDTQGLTFSVFVVTDSTASFVILDYSQRGKTSFDKAGYATGSGGCESSGSYHPIASLAVGL